MKQLDYGKGYQYAHDAPGGYVKGERYLPDEMPDRRYYRPVNRGLEIKIGEALARLRGEAAHQKVSGGEAAHQKVSGGEAAHQTASGGEIAPGKESRDDGEEGSK
jgi:putative ATPase